MKSPTSTFKRALCAVFGHRYVVSKKITSHVAEYTCKHCKCELTTTVSGTLDVLTPELKEINESLAKFYRKRHQVHTVA